MVPSSLSFLAGSQTNDGNEDRTIFCQDTRGQNLVQSSLLSFPTGGQGHNSREDCTKFCQDTRGQNLAQSSLLSLPACSQEERIGPNVARRLARKILSNSLCHFLPATKMTAERIGPYWQDTRGQNLVQSSLLSFPTGGQGHNSREDCTKFCEDTRGQNLVQSSLLSFPTGDQGNDGRKDWTTFCQNSRGQNLVQSSLLSFHTGGQGHDSREDCTKFCQDTRGQNLVQSSLLSVPTVTKEITAERVGSSSAGELCPELWLPQVIYSLDVADGNDNRADWSKFCRARNN